MKRIALLATVAIWIIVSAFAVFAEEDEWICSNCGASATKFFCSECGAPKPETSVDNSKGDDPKGDNSKTEGSKVDSIVGKTDVSENDKAYQNILQFYSRACKREYDSEELNKYDVCYYVYYDLPNCGYAYLDINDDGIDELVIGNCGLDGTGTTSFSELYTLDGNGKPVKLIKSGEYSHYYLSDENIICITHSFDDISCEYYSVYRLPHDETELQYLFTYANEFWDDHYEWYYTTEDIKYEEFVSVSEEVTSDYTQQYNYTEIPYTPFLQYPYLDAADVFFDYNFDNDRVSGLMRGYDTDGSVIWSHTTNEYDIPQIEPYYLKEDNHYNEYGGEENKNIYPITNIGVFDNKYYYCENGSVIALDIHTGEELWRTEPVIGMVGGDCAIIEMDGTLYLSSADGADLSVLSGDGVLLYQIRDITKQNDIPSGLSFGAEDREFILYINDYTEMINFELPVSARIKTDDLPPNSFNIPAEMASSIISYCLGNNIDEFSATDISSDLFWEIISYYVASGCAYDLVDEIPPSGYFGLYDSDVIREIATRVFNDFDGILPEESDYGSFVKDNEKCMLRGVGTDWGLKGISKVHINDDISVEIDYLFENRSLNELTIYKAYCERDKDGRYEINKVIQSDPTDANTSIVNAEMVVNIYNSVLDDINEFDDYSRLFYQTFSAQVEELGGAFNYETVYDSLSVNKDKSMTKNIYGKGTARDYYTGGKGENISENERDYEYLYDKDGIYLTTKIPDYCYYEQNDGLLYNFQYPQVSKKYKEGEKINDIIYFEEYFIKPVAIEEIYGCNINNNTIFFSRIMPREEIPAGIKNPIESLAYYSVTLDRYGRPSRINFNLDTTEEIDMKQASYAISESIRFLNYGNVTIEVPDDLNEYNRF